MRCDYCLSHHHTTEGHYRLTETLMRWEPLVIGSPSTQIEIFDDGTPGGPSPSVRLSAPMDQVAIVRFTISAPGWTEGPEGTPATLRLWRRGALGEPTFMLSCQSLTEGELESLARLCGDRGSGVSVELKFGRTTLTEALVGT